MKKNQMNYFILFYRVQKSQQFRMKERRDIQTWRCQEFWDEVSAPAPEGEKKFLVVRNGLRVYGRMSNGTSVTRLEAVFSNP